MLREIILMILIFQISKISADCNYDNYERSRPGIFLRPFGNETIIFKAKSSFRIPEEGHVQVYCFSGIETNEYDEWGPYLAEEGEKIKNLTIRCNKHRLDYKVTDRSKVAATSKIRCGGTNANFYKSPIEYCPYDNFVFGLPVMDRSVVLLELCYSFLLSDFIFFHYTASKRSPFLERQEQFNPSNIPLKLDELQKFIFPNKPLRTRNSDRIDRNENKFNLTMFAGSTEFQLSELVHFEKYVKIFDRFLGDTTEVNSVIWWSSLLNGNWKIFEQLLEKEAQENDLDVFAGKSGILTYPYDDKCGITNELSFEINGVKRSVPLLIWHYVKSRNSKANNPDVVILAVNSPFFEGGDDIQTVICKDMCDEVPWLESLTKTRKMAAFGFIFCCRPDDVKSILDGFPIWSDSAAQIEKVSGSNVIKRLARNSTQF